MQEVGARIDAAGCDFEVLEQLVGVQQKLECELDELMERWTYLNELAEAISKKPKPSVKNKGDYLIIFEENHLRDYRLFKAVVF